MKKLKDLVWMAQFRAAGIEGILRKSSIKKGEQIGVLNEHGKMVYLDAEIEVMEIPKF